MNYQQAKTLGIQTNWSQYYLSSMAFFNNTSIWEKKKVSVKPEHQKLFKSQKFEFFKVGKTFGFETSRYIEYINGILYYFEGEKDKQCKGYCILENIYMYYFKKGDNFIMHLTNGTDFSSFHFLSTDFMKYNESLMLKDVVQVNIDQKYQIGDQIGEGTFSKVYLGTNKFYKYPVALKIIPKINSVEDIYTKNFVMQEKRILRFLKSPLIGELYEFYEDNNNFIFVLEFLEGKDLSVYFKQKKQLSSNQCIFILKQLLKALIQLHKRNIIHRDLKPHNIIFNPQKNTVKLIDFGLSLFFDDKTELSKYMRCGTMGYIAPEIVNNTPTNKKRYDCKSDMFGFGIIAHMLLIGYNPIRGRSYKQTVQRNLACNLNFDKKLILDKYGEDCYILLYSLLQKDPNLRPTAEQALQNPFLQKQHIDIPIINSEIVDKKLLKNHKNDDANMIEDTTYGGDEQKSQAKEQMTPNTPIWKSKMKQLRFS